MGGPAARKHVGSRWLLYHAQILKHYLKLPCSLHVEFLSITRRLCCHVAKRYFHHLSATVVIGGNYERR